MRISTVVFDGDTAVEEKEARALAINHAIEEDISEHVERQWTRIKQFIAVGILLAIGGLGALIAGSSSLGIVLFGAGLLVGGGGITYVRSIDPDINIKEFEKGYWTGYMIPDGDETVIFDATESVHPSEFSLELLENPERAEMIEQQIDRMQEFPVVMTEQQNIEQDFIEALTEIRSDIRNPESYKINAPVLAEDEQVTETLSHLAQKADEETVDAGGVSLSLDEAREQKSVFDEFESVANEDRGESVLLNVSKQSREMANELSGLQETAIDLLNDHIQTAGDLFGLVSYNFYCSDCMDEDVESRLDILESEWHCSTCRSNFRRGDGIPRHKIRDEIVLDVVDQLWIEKDDQRREIYEKIEDQKAELREREFEQRREEIRTSEDRIKETRARIRDLQTEAKAKEGIVEEIGEMMVKYERLNEQKKEQFQQDITDSFEEIDKKTEQTLEETEGIIQERISDAEKEAEEKAEILKEEERQRNRDQAAYKQQLENENDGSLQQEDAENGTSNTIMQANQNKPSPRGK